MKRIVYAILLVFILTMGFGTCGPNCIEEERQMNSCLDLVLVGYLSCAGNAASQTDAQLGTTQSNLCFSSMIAGFVLCGTQKHPQCTY